jgi:hypothetical protein
MSWTVVYSLHIRSTVLAVHFTSSPMGCILRDIGGWNMKLITLTYIYCTWYFASMPPIHLWSMVLRHTALPTDKTEKNILMEVGWE